MLSSGICQVKILRKNLDLGLSVICMYPFSFLNEIFEFSSSLDSRSSRIDDVPIISEVKRGSIAYRCGMIQAGDQLLSIDTHSLRGKSLNEIALLLKTSDDIVRLRIKKDDIYSEDNLCENVVVYKVQLFRQG
jgi:C-terminal processing protease CtpA/Prc